MRLSMTVLVMCYFRVSLALIVCRLRVMFPVSSLNVNINEPWHGISNNVVSATCKTPDQPAHTRSLIRAFARRLNII